ncbi:MAG: YdcF family protein [Pseudomonadota bacterium]
MSAPTVDQDIHEQAAPGRRRWLKIIYTCVVAMAAALVIGFGLFVSVVQSYQVPDVSARADGIVVLTGGYARLDPAVGLLRNNRGRELLITGVNENTSTDTIRKVLAVDPALFDCCVTLDREALDTVGNAQMAVAWAREKGFTSVLWVTNDYHMQRSLLEVERVGASLTVIPFPVSNAAVQRADFSHFMDRYRVLAGEYAKYLLAVLRFG